MGRLHHLIGKRVVCKMKLSQAHRLIAEKRWRHNHKVDLRKGVQVLVGNRPL